MKGVLAGRKWVSQLASEVRTGNSQISTLNKHTVQVFLHQKFPRLHKELCFD